MEIKLENLTNLVKILSWSKIAQFALFLVLIGLSYGVWENRVTVYNSLKVGARVESDGPLVIDLSTDTQAYIDSAVIKSKETIIGIQIVSVNFKKNSRTTSYFSTNDATLQKTYGKFLETQVSPLPLFSNGESSNQRIINLINGDFICKNITDMVIDSRPLRGDLNIKSICSISIPPYYGRFSGYMNILLPTEETKIDITFMRQLARDISNRIYETDIDKTMKYRLN